MTDCSLIRWHPIAATFPILANVCALARSIGRSGLRQPITLLDGMILDGRARHVACSMAGYELTPEDYEHWYGSREDAIAVVVRQHYARSPDPFGDDAVRMWIAPFAGQG